MMFPNHTTVSGGQVTHQKTGLLAFVSVATQTQVAGWLARSCSPADGSNLVPAPPQSLVLMVSLLWHVRRHRLLAPVARRPRVHPSLARAQALGCRRRYEAPQPTPVAHHPSLLLSSSPTGTSHNNSWLANSSPSNNTQQPTWHAAPHSWRSAACCWRCSRRQPPCAPRSATLGWPTRQPSRLRLCRPRQQQQQQQQQPRLAAAAAPASA